MAEINRKLAGNSTVPKAREIGTFRSSNGCLNSSKTWRWNSGSSSRNRTPWCANEISPGRGGEIQLTDALEAAVANPEIAGGVRGVIFSGDRFDTGDKVGFLKAAMILGTRREDIGPELSAWLKEYAKTL